MAARSPSRGRQGVRRAAGPVRRRPPRCRPRGPRGFTRAGGRRRCGRLRRHGRRCRGRERGPPGRAVDVPTGRGHRENGRPGPAWGRAGIAADRGWPLLPCGVPSPGTTTRRVVRRSRGPAGERQQDPAGAAQRTTARATAGRRRPSRRVVDHAGRRTGELAVRDAGPPDHGELKLHDGTDFAAACGTPVRAVADGRVVAVTYDPAYGQRVVVDHGGGVETSYNHLARASVRSGAAVRAGAVVGAVGSTGMSTGCHLHFMVRADGAPVDPVRFLA